MRKPHVGQKICLNNHGLKVIFGSTTGLSFMRQKIMKITKVGDRAPVYGYNAWYIDVDDPEINKFMFDSSCFDKVLKTGSIESEKARARQMNLF